MKLFIVLVVLCALAACAVEASPRHWLKYRQLQNQQQQQDPNQAPLELIQKRMWTKTKTKSKWTALRRSSEQAQIEDHHSIDAEFGAEPQDLATEQLAAEVAAEPELLESPVPEFADEAPAEVPAAAAAPAAAADEEPIVPAFPPHTFFPMNFGNMQGGSLAVANAFSTGKGGAFSHAVAHGAKRS